MKVASFHVIRYPRAHRGAAAARMYFDRPDLRATPGLRFWRLLGTARGQSLSLGADLDRWAMFAVWDSAEALAEFGRTSPVAQRWHDHAEEVATVELGFVSGHGSWDRTFPFTEDDRVFPPETGPIAVLTRAAVRPSQLVRFYRAVPAIDRHLAEQPGLLRSVGVGEWPLARQATFSMWTGFAAMTGFSYRTPDHLDVVRRTREQSWYREEMFCRFAVTNAEGDWNGTPVLTGSTGCDPTG